MKTLVDTGAAVTIMHEDLLARVRTKETQVKPVTKTILGANNTPLNVTGSAEVDISVCGTTVRHDVLICNDLSQVMLIGVDYLKPHRCVVDFEKNKLKIGKHEETLLYSNDRKVCRVTIAKSVVIPAYTMATISCKVENGSVQNGETGVLEPTLSFEERYKTGILKVAATIKDGEIPVRLFNLTPMDRRIYKGSSVGQLFPLVASETSTKNCYFVSEHVIENETKGMDGGLCSTVTVDSGNNKCLLNIKELFPIKNDSLTDVEKESIYQILMRHNAIISGNKADLGEARDVQHFINTGDHAPIRVSPRRLPFHKRDVVQKEVESMLASDVIEPSSSPWSAPVVLVKKKDGSERFCIDYRKLNSITKKDVFPLPRCDEILESLSGAAYFTHLDLVRGYWQIKVAEEDREKTAFSTPDGHYQFKRMPFGLTNAPATFQRAMNAILAGLSWTDCLVYLDDIVVIGRTLAEHNQRLENVLERLEAAGLKLNAKKCELVQEQSAILGHIVSKEGISPDPGKVKVLQEWPVPNNLTDLRSFLGCAGYYRQYIRDYAKIAEPLYRLERKGAIFKWNDDCHKAFEILKKKLTTAPILPYPQHDLAFILDTDASDSGIGAVLSQSVDGEEKVIAYAARSLSKAERNYSTTRKELLALVWSMEHFSPYLIGKPFKARTDHNALKWIKNFKQPKGQVARWIERLAVFDFEIEHRPGRNHGNADGVSRIPSVNSSTETSVPQSAADRVHNIFNDDNDSNLWCHRWTSNNLMLYQHEDPEIGLVIKWLQDGKRPPREAISSMGPTMGKFWSKFDQMSLVDGLLFRSFENEKGDGQHLQLCVPRILRNEVLEFTHDIPSAGHLGSRRSKEVIKKRFYWPNWEPDVEIHCKNCRKCAERNDPPKKSRSPLIVEQSGYPMERVAIDIIGPLPKTNNGNRYILVAVDYFTRWPEAYAIPNQEARTIAQKLVDEWVCRYGVMQRLHTDQGRNFESDVFKEITDILGIKKTRTTPYHPQSDGMVERMNRTLKSILSKLVNERQDDWDMWLPQALLSYRSTVHSSTGFSPHLLMFGRETRLPIDLVAPTITEEAQGTRSEFVESMKKRFERTYELTRGNTQKACNRYKDYYDAKAKEATYKVGDKVWLHVPVVKKGKNLKLSRPWQGPYTVVKRLSDVVYRIELVSNKRKRLVVHFNRLKPCYIDQSIENQLGHRNGKYISRTQMKRDLTIEDTGSTVTQGTSNQDTGNTDDDEEEWVVITYPKRNTRQVTREDISPTPEEELQDPPTSTTEILQDNLQQRATHDSSVTRENISPAPLEELQDPPTSTTEILQDNLQQRATHDSSPMSRYEKTRSSSEICDDTVDVKHQSSPIQTPMLERHTRTRRKPNWLLDYQ